MRDERRGFQMRSNFCERAFRVILVRVGHALLERDYYIDGLFLVVRLHLNLNIGAEA